MESASKPNLGRDAESAGVTALFRQAALHGRNTLNAAELGVLLSALGIGLDASGPPGGKTSSSAELRFSLNNTREFGMVISAGVGGLDAELDERNFRKDRASVYAAVELTDPEDFLCLFGARSLTRSWPLRPQRFATG